MYTRCSFKATETGDECPLPCIADYSSLTDINRDLCLLPWLTWSVLSTSIGATCYQSLAVMLSETVGLRARPGRDQKKSVLQVWCCVVKHGLVTLIVIMILNDTATFQVLFIVSLFWSWNITSVEINSGVSLT